MGGSQRCNQTCKHTGDIVNPWHVTCDNRVWAVWFPHQRGRRCILQDFKPGGRKNGRRLPAPPTEASFNQTPMQPRPSKCTGGPGGRREEIKVLWSYSYAETGRHSGGKNTHSPAPPTPRYTTYCTAPASNARSHTKDRKHGSGPGTAISTGPPYLLTAASHSLQNTQYVRYGKRVHVCM